ncbi:MAG: hypothetical protein HC828_20085 [Blastochloris sp.]|nr:hypothetical protein [Blastochloris sp.]
MQRAPEGIPLASVAISGTTSVLVGEPLNLSIAGGVLPLDATRPISITWTPEPDSGQGTVDAVYTFSVPVTTSVTVVLRNLGGVSVVSDTLDVTVSPDTIPLASVALEGPTRAFIGSTSTFTASITPANATNPTYTWSPEPTSGQGTPAATYTWATTGTQTVRVTVSNDGGEVIDELEVLVQQRRVYLPLIVRGGGSQGVNEIPVGVGEGLAFSSTQIGPIDAGTEAAIAFTNNSFAPHNLVLLNTDDAEVAASVATAGAEAEPPTTMSLNQPILLAALSC